MSDDRVFEITCGCCGAKIHVDPRRRNVYFTEKVGKADKSFEERVEKAKTLDPKASDEWQAGIDAEKERKAKLEQLFDKASEKAKKDPNERPPSIWDYE